jgi:hypothetical protein
MIDLVQSAKATQLFEWALAEEEPGASSVALFFDPGLRPGLPFWNGRPRRDFSSSMAQVS